jgi:aspartyl aminopeptidase
MPEPLVDDPRDPGGLFDFIARSPSPYHAVAAAAARLDAAGFRALEETASWAGAGVGAWYVARGGAIVAWRGGGGAAATGLRIVGAHTDSPNLRLKPRPDTGGSGWRQLGVEVYGGVLANSWLDRDLGLSGRYVRADGSVGLVHVQRPLARVAQLAVHLDRDVNEKGLVLDRQTHLTPIWGLGDAAPGSFAAWLAGEAGEANGSIVAWDLMFHDLTAPALLGVDSELIAAGRIDNLFSCWAAIEAIARHDAYSDRTTMVCLFDHEEVGSASATGAEGPLLETVIRRVVAARGGGVDELHRALAASACVSADMAHAVHPNYAERHEPGHRPLPNRGPVLKVNASQRYATDAPGAALFVAACERVGVPWQVFVSRNNMPCGSTIGPIAAARLGITTVDVGCAQLSMHSARELAGAHDPTYLVLALQSFLAA